MPPSHDGGWRILDQLFFAQFEMSTDFYTSTHFTYERMNARMSTFMVSAWEVCIPCGKLG